MMYTHGISREGDLLDLALADKAVEKSGSWFNYGDLRLGQGRENAKQYLRDNPAVADEIAARVIASRGPVVDPGTNGQVPPAVDDLAEEFEEA
jgi:recombination protein RecA